MPNNRRNKEADDYTQLFKSRVQDPFQCDTFAPKAVAKALSWTFLTLPTVDFSGSGANSVQISAMIAGSSGLALTGSGTLILSGNNTYAGGTFVDAGTLIATNPDALPAWSNLSVGSATSLAAFDSPMAGGVVPVPEPGTLALVLAALGGAVVWPISPPVEDPDSVRLQKPLRPDGRYVLLKQSPTPR